MDSITLWHAVQTLLSTESRTFWGKSPPETGRLTRMKATGTVNTKNGCGSLVGSMHDRCWPKYCSHHRCPIYRTLVHKGLRTFTLIVYVLTYCVYNSGCNVTPHHASSVHAEEKLETNTAVGGLSAFFSINHFLY